MEEVLYAWSIPRNDFPQLVADCAFPASAFVLYEYLPAYVIPTPQERQELLRFMHYTSDIDKRLAEYTSGRVFDADAELRWERQGNTMQVVYLGSKERAHRLHTYKLDPNDALGGLKPAVEKRYFLFGERLEPDDVQKIGSEARLGDFAEVRIPRLLRYPVEQNKEKYVRLVVREYCDEENRVMVFRFQGLEQWSPLL